MPDLPAPHLERVSSHGVSVWTDMRLAEEFGVVVAFTERSGGVSTHPFTGLNLASHVGDDPNAVDSNRDLLFHALGLSPLRDDLTMCEQVHGDKVLVVGRSEVGSGARAIGGKPPIAATDALLSELDGVPLMLCFADCVPIVLVAPGPVIAVVHAGWRGALASLPGTTVGEITRVAGCDATDVRAYIGPHIAACHYQVDETIMSHFVNAFGTLARADSGGLNLEAAVTASLSDAGVATCSIACLGTCTAEATDRFFSYRAEQGLTGRHAAFACIVPQV